ncbi:hypothetical protein [Salinisphaera sp. SPP-AMP-43]
MPALGYRLYGLPAITGQDDGTTDLCQAVVWSLSGRR